MYTNRNSDYHPPEQSTKAEPEVAYIRTCLGQVLTGVDIATWVSWVDNDNGNSILVSKSLDAISVNLPVFPR